MATFDIRQYAEAGARVRLVELHAEATPNVRRDDAHVLLSEAEMIRVDGAHLVRHLRRLVNGELALARIE